MNDLTPKERAFMLGWKLGKGGQLTTADIAQDYEITQRGAARLMNELSRVVPIVRDLNGQWQDVEIVIIDSD